MMDDYHLLTTLIDFFNKNDDLIKDILIKGKENFSNDENSISVVISIINDFHTIISNLGDILILSPKLNELIIPVYNYYKNMFNEYKFVNAYKLYDCLYINLTNIKNFLTN